MTTATITGTLICYKYARHHHKRNLLESLLLDAIKPLPPYTLWVIRVDDESSPIGDEAGRYRQYRTKSGRLPKSIGPASEGQTITVKARVTPWSNKLGAYLSDVKLVPPPTVAQLMRNLEASVAAAKAAREAL